MKYCNYVLIAIFTFVLSAFSVTFSAGDAQAGWTIKTIDGGSGTDVGLYSSLKVTYLGRVDISYWDYTNRSLKYATNRQGRGWNISTVDDSDITGMYTSLALSPKSSKGNNRKRRRTQVRHISYFDYDSGKLMYAAARKTSRRDYVNFKDKNKFTVDDGNRGSDSVGWYSSISTAADILPHIAYYDHTNENLKYAHSYANRRLGFITETVDGDSETDVGSHCSIINVDANGGCYISYRDNTNNMLKCATNVNGDWTSEDVASDGEDNSITKDSNGNIHIAYYHLTDGTLMYATNKSGSWVTSLVDDTRKGMDSRAVCGRYNSIAVDDSGYVHISYFDASTDSDDNDLKYATNKSGSWVVTTLDSEGIVGMYTSLALNIGNVNRRGKIFISYYDMTNGALKLATFK